MHLAAGTYSSFGQDYYCGPLSTDGEAETNSDNCMLYDQFFELTELESLEHVAYFNCLNDPECDENIVFPGYETPAHFFNYPAHGDDDESQAEFLAPFFDYNNDNLYDPEDGDCPLFVGMLSGEDCPECDALEGQKALFWIDNDKGNLHTESYGDPLGIEIHNQAYAYETNNALNNMTFYKKKIINRSSTTYTDVYIGIWVDSDLGNGSNDYVGCDIERNYGYTYNGTATDPPSGSSPGYGNYPPAVGIQILKSPLLDADELDNDDDGIIDNEETQMSGFITYSNTPGEWGNPTISAHYYNYLRSFSQSGTPINFNDIGLSHMYGGDSYALDIDWSEDGEGNTPGDRRMLVNMGPFTLEGGEEVCIKYAAIWAKPSAEEPDVKPLLDDASAMAIALNENCGIMTSVDERLTKATSSFFAYPNPANNQITLKTESQGTLTIFDLSGRQVLKQLSAAGSQIDISNLSVGSYVLQFETQSKKTARQLLEVR